MWISHLSFSFCLGSIAEDIIDRSTQRSKFFFHSFIRIESWKASTFVPYTSCVQCSAVCLVRFGSPYSSVFLVSFFFFFSFFELSCIRWIHICSSHRYSMAINIAPALHVLNILYSFGYIQYDTNYRIQNTENSLLWTTSQSCSKLRCRCYRCCRRHFSVLFIVRVHRIYVYAFRICIFIVIIFHFALLFDIVYSNAPTICSFAFPGIRQQQKQTKKKAAKSEIYRMFNIQRLIPTATNSILVVRQCVIANCELQIKYYEI